METTKKARWFGPKQIGIMVYTAIIFAVSACIVGGLNNTVFPALAELRGWDLNLMNSLSGIAAILPGVGILFFSNIVAKIGPRLAMFIGCLVMAVCTYIWSHTTNIVVFFIFLFIGALSSAFFEKCGNTQLTANWWPTKKGIVLGWSTMGVISMSIFWSPLMPTWIAAGGFENVFLIVSIIVVLIGIAGLIFVRNTPEEAGTYPDGDPNFYTSEGAKIGEMMRHYKSDWTVGKVFSNKNCWFFSIAAFFGNMSALCLIASTIPYLLQNGYELPVAASIMSIASIISLGGSWGLGLIDQKVGVKKAYYVFFIIMIVGFVCMFFAGSSVVMAWIACILVYGANGAGYNLCPSACTSMFGRWDFASGFRSVGTFFGLGSGIGIMLTGLMPLRTCYIVCIVCLIIGFIFVILAKADMVGTSDEDAIAKCKAAMASQA